MASRSTGRYRPELDGIRTLAIAGVLLFHASRRLPFRFWGGEFGVDLFFVLSGVLITTLLLQEHEASGTIGLREFYTRRVLRLMPALVAFLIVSAVVVAFVHHDLATYPSKALFAFFAIGNWVQGAGGDLSPLTHTWSLAIEWQFYLLWPAILIVALKRGTSLRRLAAAVAGTAVVVAVIRAVAFHHLGEPQAMFWTITRADGVLLGSATALAIADGGRIATLLRRPALALGAAAVAAVLVANLHAGTSFTFDGGLFLMVVAFAVVVGHVAVRRDGAISRVLSVRPLPQIGLISYGIYLFHVPVNQVLFVRAGKTGLGWVLASFAVDILVALVSFVVIERPAQKLRRLWALVPRRSPRVAGDTPTVHAAPS